VKDTTITEAKHDVANAAQDAVRTISIATESAAKTISVAAAEASKVVLANASQTAKTLAVGVNSDHDTLVILDTKMDSLADQIRELRDNNARRIDQLETEKLNCRDSYPVLYKKDVEDRLQSHEGRIKTGEITDTRLIAYGTTALFLIGVIEFVLGKYF
jgi:hypothetical protein